MGRFPKEQESDISFQYEKGAQLYKKLKAIRF